MRTWEALRYRDFRRFWIGALISNTGGWMQRMTVPFVLFELTHSASWVGFAAFCQFLPVVVMGPIGGSIADRFARRRTLLVTQSAMAGLALVLWALWVTGRASPWAITAVVVAVGAAFGVNGPTWQAFVSELVPPEVLLNAVTLNSTQFNAARAAGPALAGLALAVWGPGAAFLLNALSSAAVLIALGLVRPRSVLQPQGGRARPLREMLEAVRYARRHRGILAAMVTVSALGLLGGPLVQLLVVFADEVFEVGKTSYGLLGAALGVGAVLGAPLVAGRGSRMARSRLLTLSLGAYGFSLVGFALAPTYSLALAVLLVSGAGWLAIASTLNTTIQLQVEEQMRGKELALYLMLLTLSMPIGSLAQGWLADVIGPRPTVAGAGALFLAVGGLLVRATDLLPHMDRERSADGLLEPRLAGS